MNENLKIMVDIETIGNSVPDAPILSIAMVSCKKNESGFWVPGKSVEVLCHTDREPETVFAKEHQRQLYADCKARGEKEKWVVAKSISDFLESHDESGDEGPSFFMGWNAAGFDIPILVKNGLLTPPVYVKVPGEDREVLVGDFHYRILDVQSIYNFVRENVTGCPRDRRAFDESLIQMRSPVPMTANPFVKHTALNDCMNQVNTLNKLIMIAKET